MAQLIGSGRADRIPKGELCLTDEAIDASGFSTVGFEEQVELTRDLGLDLVTLSPDYQAGFDRLPSPATTAWPDLDRWRSETSLFLFALLDGAFEWGMRVQEPVDFLVRLIRDPGSLQPFIRQVEAFNLHMVDRLVSQGIDGIILADDIATQHGLYARPQVMRDLFIPSLSRQADGVRSRGVPAFFHSDGDYRPLVADVVGAGFTGLHCLERRAGMGVDQVRAQVGDRICLWGHLDVDDVNRAADPQERTVLVDSIRDLAADGPFILGTTSGIFAGIDVGLLKGIYDEV